MSNQDQLLEGDLELIIASCMRRIDQGEAVNQQQLLMDHPYLRAELEAYFADVALIEQLAGPTASDLLTPASSEAHGKTVTFDGAIAPVGSEQAGQKLTENRQNLQGQFGRYWIEEILGEGAMGAVYLAHDQELDRRVALKVPKIDASDSAQELLERFYREARAAATLRHRGICPVYDVGTEDGVSYIAMAYIPGLPLSRLMSLGKIKSMRNIAVVIRKLAMALESAHQKGVIHRDLKPANVMVDEDNEPVIMDFGLARQLNREEASRLTLVGTIMGSPAYMSPEQVSGDINLVGCQSDIYNLGVMLYELLTGRVPFEGPVVVIIGQIIGTEPGLPSTIKEGIDPELEVICLKMMAKKKEDRYQSMQEVVDALTACLKQIRKSTAGKSENEDGKGSAGGTAKQRSTQPASQLENSARKRKTKQSPKTIQPQTLIDKIKNASGRPKVIAAAFVAVPLLVAAAITLFFRVEGREVSITIDDPTVNVVFDGKQHVEFDGKLVGHVELDVGPHKVTVTRNGTIVEGWNKFNYVVHDEGQNQLEIHVQDKEAVTQNKPKEKELQTKNSTPEIKYGRMLNDRPLHKAAGAETVPLANDYDKLATVEWLNFFDTIGLKDFQKERAGLRDGLFELRGTGISWPRFSAKDLIFRAKVKQLTGTKFEIYYRGQTSPAGFKQYSVSVELPNKFSIARKTGQVIQDLKTVQIVPVTDADGFIEIAFAAINDRLTLYVNGTEIADVTDDLSSEGGFGFTSFPGEIQIKDVELMLLDTPEAGDWINLITSIDLNSDVISGDWEIVDNALRMKSGGYTNIVQLSAKPKGSYELELAFTRHDFDGSKATALTLPAGEQAVDAVFFGWGTRELSGLAAVDGLEPDQPRSPCRTSAFKIIEGKRHEIRLQVLVKEAEATISVFTDGKKLYSWQGQPSKLISLFQSGLAIQKDKVLLVNHGNGPTTFHKIRWRPIRTWPPGPAENVIPGFVDRPTSIPGLKRWQVISKTSHSSQTCVTFSPDQKEFACVCGDGLIRIYDTQTLKLIRLLRGHTSMVQSVVYRPDGKQIASAGIDNTVRLWSADGTPELVLKVDDVPLTSVAYRPDGQEISAGGYDNKIYQWSVDGTPRLILSGHTSPVISLAYRPDGKQLASASRDKTVRLWNTDGSSGPVLKGYSHNVSCVAWRPDGKQLASAGDMEVRLWSVEGTPEKVLKVMERGVLAVAYRPDGQQIAAAGADRIIQVWDREGIPGPVFTGHSHQINSLAYSPDGKQILSGAHDSAVFLHDLDGSQTRFLKGSTSVIRTVAYRPDGQQLATGGTDGTVRLWNPDGTPGPVLSGIKVNGFIQPVHTVIYRPDGRELASAGSDGKVRIWQSDGSAGPVFSRIDTEINSLAYRPDGKQVAAGCFDHTVRLWSSDGIPQQILKGHKGSISSVAYHLDGKQLASVSYDNTLRLWNMDDSSGTVLDEFTSPINVVCFRPDGKQFVTGGKDRILRLWSSEGTPIGTFKGNYPQISDLDYHPRDQKVVIAGGNNLSKPDDFPIHIVSMTGAMERTLNGHNTFVASVKYRPDGNQIASASWDQSLRLWNAKTGEPQLTIVPLSEERAVVFTAAGELLQSEPAEFDDVLVYITEPESGGQEILTPTEFYAKYRTAPGTPHTGM
tara:strand:+ start:13971 stop:18884 length:4914 start_codon:yes stop_codon:yes gene_type:complete